MNEGLVKPLGNPQVAWSEDVDVMSTLNLNSVTYFITELLDIFLC
jgi:hypothetical protein